MPYTAFPNFKLFNINKWTNVNIMPLNISCIAIRIRTACKTLTDWEHLYELFQRFDENLTLEQFATKKFCPDFWDTAPRIETLWRSKQGEHVNHNVGDLKQVVAR